MTLTLILKKKQGDNCRLDSSGSGYWLTAANTVMKVHIPHLRSTSEPNPSTQGEFCSMESQPFMEIS